MIEKEPKPTVIPTDLADEYWRRNPNGTPAPYDWELEETQDRHPANEQPQSDIENDEHYPDQT